MSDVFGLKSVTDLTSDYNLDTARNEESGHLVGSVG